MSYKLTDISDYINGQIEGDINLVVEKFSPFLQAEKNDITFASDQKYLKDLNKTKAGVIIIPDGVDAPKGKTCIRVKKSPREVMPYLLSYFKIEVKDIEIPIEKSSLIHKSAKLSPNIYIGHDVKIGKNTFIYPNVTILEGSTIGDNCIIYPNVTIREFTEVGNNVIVQSGAVIGSDGFGYIRVDGKHKKLEQIGRVIIKDNVEVGANVTIDRGAIGDTIVGDGTKIDNLVHIAHNDRIGNDCLLIAQVGISGSVDIGNNVVIAGQAGIAGHLKIGDNVVIGAKSGVTNDIKSNSKVSGFPLKDHKEDLKIKVSMSRLPELVKRVKKLEKKMN